MAALAEEMDVARFNFSHGSHESHLEMLGRVRAAAEKQDVRSLLCSIQKDRRSVPNCWRDEDGGSRRMLLNTVTKE